MTPAKCVLPVSLPDAVQLGQGAGGKLATDLVREIFLPAFSNRALDKLDEQAALEIQGARLAVTTDSFVVSPLFFPGGDIGSLAVHGTLNDLVAGGARPLFLSAAFILEEGFPTADLRRIVESMAAAAADAGVSIVAGDTKVVERGRCDGVYINTTGIGLRREGVVLSADRARPHDAVILSGSLGEHGAAILSRRHGLELGTALKSDSALLHSLADQMYSVSGEIRCMRHPTRGGLAGALNAIATQSDVGITIFENTLVIRDSVRCACGLLGLDPLCVASGGRLVAVVSAESSGPVLDAMRRHPLGRDAAIIGIVSASRPGTVGMRLNTGATRLVDALPGDQLARIC